MTTLNAPCRSLLSFSLRTLLIAVTLACFGAGFCVHWRQRQERKAIASLRAMSIDSHYDHQHAALPPMELAYSKYPFVASVFPKRTPTEPDAPKTLRRMLGDDYFQSVTAATIFTNEVREIKFALPHLKQLRNLKEILLYSPPCPTGDGAYGQCHDLLRRELPHAKITPIGGLPIVG